MAKRLQTIHCKHYTGTAYGKECEVGVKYDQFMGTPFDGWPCFGKRGQPHPQGEKCPQCRMPTEEELQEEDRLDAVRFEKMSKARAAIVAHLGGPWKKGTPGSSGTIDCPACGGKGTLKFSRAGYNGHVHAACITLDCVQWME